MLLLCMFIRPHLHGTCRWTARQVRRKGNRQPYVVCNSIHETLCWFLALRQAKLSPQEANIMHFMTLRSLTHPVLHRVVWKTSRTAPVSSTMQMSGALPCKSSSASICTPVDLTGVQSSSRSFPCTTRSWCPPACNEGWYSDVYTIRLDSLAYGSTYFCSSHLDRVNANGAVVVIFGGVEDGVDSMAHCGRQQRRCPVLTGDCIAGLLIPCRRPMLHSMHT